MKLLKNATWIENYEKALALAKKDNRVILADFSGSDWCGWCIKLDEEVLTKKAFKDFAGKKLVLLKLDFPRSKPQADALVAQNKALMKKFGVRGFPTVLLLDSSGKKIGQTGYQAGGPENYVKHIQGLINK